MRRRLLAPLRVDQGHHLRWAFPREFVQCSRGRQGLKWWPRWAQGASFAGLAGAPPHDDLDRLFRSHTA